MISVHQISRFALAATLAVLAIGLTATPGATSATPQPGSLLGRNLVVNGNAEAAQGLPHIVPIPGWAVTGGFTAVNYGYDSYPSSQAPGPADRGYRFFSGGTNNALSTARQGIDVTGLGQVIDAGMISYTFTAWIGGSSNHSDYATVTVTFYNAAHAKVGSAQLGPVTNADRQGITALLRRTTGGAVPAGTRRIGVEVVATRFSGASNDGYTDNISLVLAQK